MKHPPEIEDCYFTETGTPTLTVKMSQEQRMIPWTGFLEGSYRVSGDCENIELQFQDHVVVMQGRDLDSLWETCQMQDLRWVQSLKHEIADQWAGDCVVTSLQLKPRET